MKRMGASEVARELQDRRWMLGHRWMPHEARFQDLLSPLHREDRRSPRLLLVVTPPQVLTTIVQTVRSQGRT